MSSPSLPCFRGLKIFRLTGSYLCFLQLLVDIMSLLKMGLSIHLSTPMNIPTHRTVAGSSLFPMDMGFTSTLLYCRQSLSQIILLSGKSAYILAHSWCLCTNLDRNVQIYLIHGGNNCILDRLFLRFINSLPVWWQHITHFMVQMDK